MIKGKKIIVTGGSGFLGSHIVELLKGNNEIIIPRSKDYNLAVEAEVIKLFKEHKNIDIVIHAAADIGGIGYSSTHPAKQYYNNVLINTNILHHSYLNDVKKFVGVGSVCEYPAETPVPFKEEYLWNGYPVDTNDAYGISKRMLLAQSIAYKKEYNFNSIHLLPVNMYGPRDNFDYRNSHVIPALIRKIFDAKESNSKVVDVWGTGLESREFIYVGDVAKAIVLATEKYDEVKPVNIGSGKEIMIKEICEILKDLLDYNGEFNYLNNGLGGQKRRVLDVTKASEKFDFKAEIDFYVGLKRTIKYYEENINRIKGIE